MSDWGQAIVVDPRELRALVDDNDTLRAGTQRWKRVAQALVAVCVVGVGATAWTSRCLVATTAELSHSREKLVDSVTQLDRATEALATLARTHDNMLAATQEAPSVGTRSWGRRFTVTKYVPRSPDYGATNDGFTSTMKKADPAARIVAVDPKLIPYHSWVWIEGLGWYRAEDCGGAIKGFRLDVLTATDQDAFAYGRQDRFTIVVPPDPVAVSSNR